MKLALLLKTRRGRRGAPRLSLFPFLAVLICTMGALVLILFAVMRQARAQATREAAARIAKQQTDWQAERDAVQWRSRQLQESKQKTQSQLADMRLKLGHLEDHARRLRQRAADLESAAKQLDQSEAEVRRRQTGTREELQAIQAQVAEAERRLDAARKAVQDKPRSYAVVPYEGPNETHRRPIYLECRSDAVVLQPEGLKLKPEDFEGPLGPGNPLAASLRAVREHLVSQGVFNPDRDGEPYPLLLVRPSGIVAYYAARAGMEAWGADFGYELVGEDWKLEFPPADPRLAQVLEITVSQARRRQAEVAAAAPVGYSGKRSRAIYRAGPNGGLIRESGPARDDDDDDTSGFQSQSPGERYANSAGAGGGGFGGRGGGYGGGGGGFGDSSGGQGGDAAAGTGRGYAGGGGSGGTGSSGSGSGNGPGGFGGNGPGMGGNGPGMGGSGSGGPGSSGPGGFGGSGGGYAAGAAPATGGGTPGGQPAGTTGYQGSAPGVGGTAASPGGPQLQAATGAGVGGSPNMGGTAPGTGGTGSGTGVPAGALGGAPGGVAGNSMSGVPSGSGSAGGFGTGLPGSSQPTQLPEGYIPGRPYETPATPPRPASNDAQLGGSQPAMPLRPGEWYPSEKPPPRHREEPDEDRPGHPKKEKIELSLAEKRGRDWALRNAAHGSVPITRPIRMECYADRLVILPEPGAAAAAPIPFEGRTGRCVDRLISAAWDHMEGWGIAGKGMYWRPVLRIRVAPGGEQRFDELSSLLEGSGFSVQREP
jgi:hypothetical protein